MPNRKISKNAGLDGVVDHNVANGPYRIDKHVIFSVLWSNVILDNLIAAQCLVLCGLLCSAV